jgi:hypothetical protein
MLEHRLGRATWWEDVGKSLCGILKRYLLGMNNDVLIFRKVWAFSRELHSLKRNKTSFLLKTKRVTMKSFLYHK